jgi:hypothetical protein
MYKTVEELRRERERDRRTVYIPEGMNPCGFRLNITTNPVINRWYERYKRKNGLRHQDPITDKQRLEFEEIISDYIAKNYEKVYHNKLLPPIIGYTEQRVEELVVMLGAVEDEI